MREARVAGSGWQGMARSGVQEEAYTHTAVVKLLALISCILSPGITPLHRNEEQPGVLGVLSWRAACAANGRLVGPRYGTPRQDSPRHASAAPTSIFARTAPGMCGVLARREMAFLLDSLRGGPGMRSTGMVFA